MTVYPWGYGTECLEIDDLFARVESEAGGPMHPNYRYWLYRWIEGQSGLIGIGDGWRPHGSDTSGASTANKSFHQTQTFSSGRSTWCAVDVVAVNPGGNHRTVQWHEVPEQGSTDAAYWNLHANVGGEPWHIQPTNIDGFDTWVADGRPDPVPAPVTTQPPSKGKVIDMYVIAVSRHGWPGPVDLVVDASNTRWNRDGNTSSLDKVAGVPRLEVDKAQTLGLLRDRPGAGDCPFEILPEYFDAELAAAW